MFAFEVCSLFFLFAVLRNSLISPEQWRSTEKSRPLHCEPLGVAALFDSVFRGSLDAPLIFTPKPLHALVLFGSAIISQNQILELGGGVY